MRRDCAHKAEEIALRPMWLESKDVEETVQ